MACFMGLILTNRACMCLTNARFGDPEIRLVLPLLDGDLLKLVACRNFYFAAAKIS